ncbi:MAG TPA: hypothetical protein VKA85_10850 [Candidatus Limnocylindrales bacterium]|nr:hypothetical protein [Candidatus Limnocylindrales bacterium]
MADFGAVEARLREILERCRGSLVTGEDRPGGLTLVRTGNGRPDDFVAAIRVGKRYVSYYLMSVYERPQLLDGISPELRRRMQGKSCFNFTRVDDALMTELEALTRAGMTRS